MENAHVELINSETGYQLDWVMFQGESLGKILGHYKPAAKHGFVIRTGVGQFQVLSCEVNSDRTQVTVTVKVLKFEPFVSRGWSNAPDSLASVLMSLELGLDGEDKRKFQKVQSRAASYVTRALARMRGR